MISANQIWKLGKIDILWQGNPISAMKTFGKLNCILCMNERLQLLKALKTDKMENTRKLINSSNELYGACRHKTKFHRYQICETSSTDEGLKSPEKSNVETVLNTPLETKSVSNYSNGFLAHNYPVCVPVENSNGSYVVDL